MFSSKSFTVSCLIFKSLSYFEFIFVYGVKVCSNFIDLFTCGCPTFPTSLAQETVFSLLYILTSFVKDKLTIGVWVYFWALYSVPLIHVSVFVLIPCCFDYCSFVILSEAWGS